MDSRTGTFWLAFPETFHHEFGHLLHARFIYLFPIYEWKSLHREVGKEDPLTVGYLSNYAKTNCKEDFAETFEMLFKKPEYVFKSARKNPVIARKVEIVMSFYGTIISGVTVLPVTIFAPYLSPRVFR